MSFLEVKFLKKLVFVSPFTHYEMHCFSILCHKIPLNKCIQLRGRNCSNLYSIVWKTTQWSQTVSTVSTDVGKLYHRSPVKFRSVLPSDTNEIQKFKRNLFLITYKMYALCIACFIENYFFNNIFLKKSSSLDIVFILKLQELFSIFKTLLICLRLFKHSLHQNQKNIKCFMERNIFQIKFIKVNLISLL